MGLDQVRPLGAQIRDYPGHILPRGELQAVERKGAICVDFQTLRLFWAPIQDKSPGFCGAFSFDSDVSLPDCASLTSIRSTTGVAGTYRTAAWARRRFDWQPAFRTVESLVRKLAIPTSPGACCARSGSDGAKFGGDFVDFLARPPCRP